MIIMKQCANRMAKQLYQNNIEKISEFSLDPDPNKKCLSKREKRFQLFARRRTVHRSSGNVFDYDYYDFIIVIDIINDA